MMPGIVMDDASANGSGPWVNSHGSNGDINPVRHPETNGASAHPSKTSNIVNGTNGNEQQRGKTDSAMTQSPPELFHITQGFFPFGQLVNRAVQRCWNELSDLINELAEIQVTAQQPQHPFPNGKSAGSQSDANVQKKLRLLEFAQAKRTEFIKLLVLSQWSRQAHEVSKLIDLQGFIRTRHMAYNAAIQRVADMKRDLVRAQIPNPDLHTALEVLTTGRVSSIPDVSTLVVTHCPSANMPKFGYKPPRPLSARRMLRVLQNINRILSTRLLLHESVPPTLQSYRVHDGRVTFTVPGEFEMDLSIGEEDPSSQFYLIDLRFLFSPSSPLPEGRFRADLTTRVDSILKTKSLPGCFDFVHNLVLSNKINVLFKQALELSRGQWAGSLRVELLHRTLVVQYWADKPGPKSWLEIGIKRGRSRTSAGQNTSGVPVMGLRWMREHKEVDASQIKFDTETLSMESILLSTIAVHTSHLLRSAYDRLRPEPLFARRLLKIRLQMSTVEPGKCQLYVQLTKSRHLYASIEPVSGSVFVKTTPTFLHRLDKAGGEDDLVGRVARLRCMAAMEEIEAQAKILGWQPVDHRGLKVDIRRLFPPNFLRAAFFRRRNWDPSWLVGVTTSLSGDDWWMLHVRTRPLPADSKAAAGEAISIDSVRVLEGSPVMLRRTSTSELYARLEHSLTGVVAMHANAFWSTDVGSFEFLPSKHNLRLGRNLEVPTLDVRYDPSTMPPSLRIQPPAGVKRNSYVHGHLHLRYYGVDPRRERAVVVAYGRFSTPLSAIGVRTTKLDDDVVIRHKGQTFAMRFVVPAGQPMIAELCQRVQRLEIVLSIFETLRKSSNITVDSFSLSRIDFSYSQGLQASLVMRLENPGLSTADAGAVRMHPEPLFPVHLDISFADANNPHRRLRQALAALLNRATPGSGGIHLLLRLLTLTLPLLKALDHLATRRAAHTSSSSRPAAVQIIARDAKTILLSYSSSSSPTAPPSFHFRFLIRPGFRRDQVIWILREIGQAAQAEPSPAQSIRTKIRETVFRGKGDGWRGLGTGAVADANSVENLLMALDACFGDDMVAAATSASAPSAPAPAQGAGQGQGQGVPTVNKKPEEPKREVIMLD